jgi:hypothetical protein
MTIWLLALVLLASLAGIGYRQGAIRVAFSLTGILAGVLLAGPLAKLAYRGLVAVGVQNPIFLWLLAPFIVFWVVLIIFKIAGWVVHRQVAVYYKYKAGDLRLTLWERMHRRLGLCLGLLNGAVYLVLISFVVYAFSYWTVQMATSDQDPKGVKILNRMGRDLQSTGMAKVARAIDPMPAVYYEAADLANMIYHTPLIEARLSRYPGFFSLAERPEFQALAQDDGFKKIRLAQQPIRDLLTYPSVESILKSPSMLSVIWDTVAPDGSVAVLKDLRGFLLTLKSAKYDGEKILGRWNFDVNGAIAALREAKPNITSREMQTQKLLFAAMAKASLVAAPDYQLVVKAGLPVASRAGAPPAGADQTVRGQWRKNTSGEYFLNLTGGSRGGEVKAQIDGDRMTYARGGLTMAFRRED